MNANNAWLGLKPRRIPFGVTRVANVANVIACASGKGGVGKSTTTVALAYTLQKAGVKVGILDCDVHGPNIACLLHAIVDQEQHNILDPVIVDNIATQSIAYWVDSDVALAWRGAMVTKALVQMMYQTRWPKLDVLLLDLPPETGDVALSICKKMPLVATFLVANANPLSLADVTRANNLFNKCDVPVLGVIENMQMRGCENCGHVNKEPFGASVVDWAKQYKVPYLSAIPYSRKLHSGSDLGNTVASGELAQQYSAIAEKLVEHLSALPRDYGLTVREEKN